MDLSKSQREVERDIMKLRYDFNKDSLNRVAIIQKMDLSRQNVIKNAENFHNTLIIWSISINPEYGMVKNSWIQ